MNKIINLLIISLLFISSNLKPQAITSPPEQGLAADFNLYDYESSLFYSDNAQGFTSVSYTHLTLPTICSV